MKKIFKHERKVFNNVIISCILIQMEYCEDGNLENYINKNHHLTSDVVIHFIDELIEAIYYFHERGIIHRDIKTRNILLFDQFKTLKIGDFGFTKQIGDGSATTQCGTNIYFPPEIQNSERYKLSSDIWSLGVVLIQLVSEQVEQSVKSLGLNIKHDPNFLLNSKIGTPFNFKYLNEFYPEFPELAEMCISCLKINPFQRVTIAELKRMMWKLKNRNIFKISGLFDINFKFQ
jgi:serine/threonine protein kinase